MIDWGAFTPSAALAGGALIGVAATWFALANGRVAGISGILGGLLRSSAGDTGWRAAFLAGLVVAPIAWRVFASVPAVRVDASYPVLVMAGLAVGIGTRYCGGCTSGHGVCGVARLSPRSLVATVAFVAAGMATAFVVRHVIAG